MIETDLKLDNWLDVLDVEWHFLYGQDADFESMDYDTQEGMYYRGLSIENAITEYKSLLV